MYASGFPGGSDGKKSTWSGRDWGLIPGSGTSPGEGSGYSLQYSCLENSMDKRCLVGYSSWGHKRFGQINVCSSDNYNVLKSVLIVIVIYSILFSSVTQWCPIVCNSVDCSPTGSSVHGILQARILEWVATPFSRGSSQPRNRTWTSCSAGGFFTIWATREASYNNTKASSGQ